MNKNIIHLILFAILGIFLNSCKKDILTNQDEIQLDNITLNLNKSGQSVFLEIPINEISNSWHVYSPSDANWLTYEVIPGRSSMYVYVDGNTTEQARESYITIRNKNYTQKIIVNQDNAGGVDLSQVYVPLRYLNSSSTITINNYDQLTDISVSIDGNGQGWLSYLLESERISLNATINDLTTARQSLVTVTAKRKISGETITSFINVYQGKGGMTPYTIAIPDFSESSVYKVMDGAKQVAQITKEYLRLDKIINAQAIVIYPVENNIVSLHKGYIAQILKVNTNLQGDGTDFTDVVNIKHGGTVSFNKIGNNIVSYAEGTETSPVALVYMPGDVGMGTEVIPASKPTTLEPHTIDDVRLTETNTYPIVKIGTQYWMGKNLVTRYYNSNKNFVGIPTGLSSLFVNPNYHINGSNDGAATTNIALTNKERFGFLYSYLAIGGFNSFTDAGLVNENDLIDDNISPNGWLVPTVQEAISLYSYIGSKGARLRNFIKYESSTVVPSDITTGDNITGFNAPNGSYKNSNSAWVNFGAANGAWYLTRSYAGPINVDKVKLFHMNSVQSAQDNYRNSSIRSINNTSIQTTDTDNN